MPIYTGGGDDGTTSLFGGERVGKHALRVELMGSIDELSAVLGMAHVNVHDIDPSPTIRPEGAQGEILSPHPGERV